MAQERKNGSSVVHGGNGTGFEAQFGRLQEVVQKLSDGNLTLQEALASFEEGMSLADSCGRMLEEAELRVQQVSDRALRAGSAQIVELDVLRSRDEEDDLLTFEVESFETAVVFELPVSEATDRAEGKGRGRSAEKGAPPKSAAPSAPLDPLFDEDD